ncbi:MAG: beta-lactamase family protein [Maricaulaceae bacterium]|nr:beta-lactamase family protein [Maricaulaceae bacterium]
MSRQSVAGLGQGNISRRDLLAGAGAAALLPVACGPGEPAAVTWRPARYDALDAALDARLAGGETPGFVALAARGAGVHVHAGGVRDLDSGAPVTPETVFAVASIGKPVTAVAALMLVDDGVLDLDGPVDRWLPELADRRVLRAPDSGLNDTVAAARPVSLRDLLTMRFGLGFAPGPAMDSAVMRRMAELGVAPGPRLFTASADEYMRRIGELPLIDHPGERWLYHNGLDVAGVLVARASGMSLGAFQRQRIFEPLGMADTGFHAPAQRLASLYWRDPETGAYAPWTASSGASFAEPPPFEAGGGGQVSTVGDFHAFGRMLLNGGVHGGRRLLSAALVAEMLTDQITAQQKAASPWFPEDFWDVHGWGLGVAVTVADDALTPAGRFGWWGGFGTAFWCDPATDSVALLFTNKMMGGADDTAMAEEFLRHAFAAARED